MEPEGICIKRTLQLQLRTGDPGAFTSGRRFRPALGLLQSVNYFYLPESIKVMSFDQGLSLLYYFYNFLGLIDSVSTVAAQ